MRALIQKVNYAKLTIKDKLFNQIDKGYVVLLGIGQNDSEQEIDYIINKLLTVKLFRLPNKKGYYHKNIKDIDGEILIVSQFTLYGTLKKGTKPSFTYAASPENAEKIYNKFVEKLKAKFKNTKTGQFAKYMKIDLENDGPTTFLLESEIK